MSGQAAPVRHDETVTLAEQRRRPGFLIRRAHQINTALFEAACGGTTNTQFGILWVLTAVGDQDQTTLTRNLLLDKTTVGVALRILQKKGWISRRISATDRRQKRISLTEAGRAAFDDIVIRAEQAQARFLGTLTPVEQRTLVGLLEKLTAVSDVERLGDGTA